MIRFFPFILIISLRSRSNPQYYPWKKKETLITKIRTKIYLSLILRFRNSNSNIPPKKSNFCQQENNPPPRTLMLPVLLLLIPFLPRIIPQPENRVDGKRFGLLLLLLLRVLHLRDGMGMRYLGGQILGGEIGAQQMRSSHAFERDRLEILAPRLHLHILQLSVLQHRWILQQSSASPPKSLQREMTVPHPVQRKIKLLHPIDAVILQQAEILDVLLRYGEVQILPCVPVGQRQRRVRALVPVLAKIEQKILGRRILGPAQIPGLQRLVVLTRSVQSIRHFVQTCRHVTEFFTLVQCQRMIPACVLKFVETDDGRSARF